MKTVYRKVAVSERLPPPMTDILIKYRWSGYFEPYHYFDDLHCKDEMLNEVTHWIEEIPDNSHQIEKLEADKAELLEALEKVKRVEASPSAFKFVEKEKELINNDGTLYIGEGLENYYKDQLERTGKFKVVSIDATSEEVLQVENYTREDIEKAYRAGEKGATYYFKDTTVILPTTYEGVDG